MAQHARRPVPITDASVAAVAAAADCDPRTVIRRLAGLPVRGRVERRIERELARLGLLESADDPPETQAA